MGLQEKLEEIRQKPEHIKLRYTYAAVAVSMLFILLIWGFSLSDSVKKATNKKQNVFEGLNEEKKSLKDEANDIKNSLDDLKKEADSLQTKLVSPEIDTSNDSADLTETDTKPVSETTNQTSLEKEQPATNNSERPMPDIIKP